jgi:hypothetical protein
VGADQHLVGPGVQQGADEFAGRPHVDLRVRVRLAERSVPARVVEIDLAPVLVEWPSISPPWRSPMSPTATGGACGFCRRYAAMPVAPPAPRGSVPSEADGQDPGDVGRQVGANASWGRCADRREGNTGCDTLVGALAAAGSARAVGEHPSQALGVMALRWASRSRSSDRVAAGRHPTWAQAPEGWGPDDGPVPCRLADRRGQGSVRYQ